MQDPHDWRSLIETDTLSELKARVYLEQLLVDRGDLRDELEGLYDQYARASAPSFSGAPIQRPGTSNPTQVAALRLLANPHVQWLERVLGAMDKGIAELSPARRQFVSLRYGKPWRSKKALMQTLRLSEDAYEELRASVLGPIAYRLGWDV